MYIDIITYQINKNITEEAFLQASRAILDDWMSKQDGFIRWEINKIKDGTYQDHVYWESEKNAEQANKNMGDIPKDHAWLSCHDMDSVSSKKAQQIYSSEQ